MLEKSKDKIQTICDALRKETLEPAQAEAQKIIDEAHLEAKKILDQANKEALGIAESARQKLQKDEIVFNQALIESSKLSMERLKQDIIHNIFNQGLEELVVPATCDSQAVATLIESMSDAIEKEGISVDFSALIPSKLPVDAVNKLLKKSILDKLREKSCIIGDFDGGVKIKLHDKNLILEITDETIVQLLQQHLRKDFRKWIFKANS